MKKILKIIAIIIGVILLLLALSPFFFESTMEKLVKKSIADNLNATVSWEDFNLSFFRSFPDAAVSIKGYSVINHAPFEGDTLARGEEIRLSLGVMQLLKTGDDPVKIDALLIDKTRLNIRIDSMGNANYDITIENDAPLSDTIESNNTFVFDLKHYKIRDSELDYQDEKSGTYLTIRDLQHEGSGDFSLDRSELETTSQALVSLRFGEVEYLTQNPVTLDATFLMDLNEQKYTFMENEARVNELPLTFEGYVQVFEDYNEVDLTFKTPSSDFKNFLAVIPKTYVKELDGVTTTGNFLVNGSLKGNIDDEHIPKMDIRVRSENASFKYPDLPKAVQNIAIDATLKNETGIAEDTYLNVGALTFTIDDRSFSANGNIQNLTGNARVDMNMKGSLDLAHIEQVLPVTMKQKLSGIFNADVEAQFDMDAVENERYQDIRTLGTASLTGFTYNDDAFQNPIEVSNANIEMRPGDIKLSNFKAMSGQTDIQANGTIKNLIPFLMTRQDLKGNFIVQSNTLDLNDFMTSGQKDSGSTATGNSEPSNTSQISIPDFLDASLVFTVKKVLYDNIALSQVKGSATIRNETITLNNVTSSLFGGSVGLSGNVSTFQTTPTFAMDLNLQKIDIDQSFGKLELLRFLAPIAKALNGNLNTTIKLEGNLNDDLTPILSSLAGNALAQIITAEVDPQQAPLLSKLGEKVSFLNLDRLSLRDVSTILTFDNGNINVKPFDFNIKDINVNVAGSHGLDQSINYDLTMKLPAKYMGGEVSGLLAKLDPGDRDQMTVSLPITLTGTFSNPNIGIDTEAAVNTLTQKLIEKQKQELKNKGTDILKDIISGSSNTPQDSTATQKPPTTPQTTTNVVKDILGGIFGNKKKDTTKSGGN